MDIAQAKDRWATREEQNNIQGASAYRPAAPHGPRKPYRQ